MAARIGKADYVHAKCFLTTRGINVPVARPGDGHGGGHGPTGAARAPRGRHVALCCPVLDLLNHSWRFNARFAPFMAQGVVQVQTCEPVEPGAQIFIEYCEADSFHLLHRYGFVEPGNPFDGPQLHITPEDEAAAAPARGGSICLLYTSPSPRDGLLSRMPSSA